MDKVKPIQKNERLLQERLRRNWRQSDLAEQLGTTELTIRRWERGSQHPSAYYRVKLCALFGKSAEELGLVDVGDVNPPPSLPAESEAASDDQTSSSCEEVPLLWNVPYARNPHFTGRDDLFEQLDRHFSAERQSEPGSTRLVALTQPQAIKGLGGIGKTQIAVEYAYRAREQERYTHTFWINASNEEALITSFAELGELLPDVAAKKETDQHKLVAAITHWLEQSPQRWLLIFDNADDLPFVQPYLPRQGNGSILLTTRAHAVSSFAASLEVETMGLVEGTHFLLHRAHRLQATDEEINEATNIVIALDGFPLALDQAGAFIEETGCCIGEYLALYQEHRQTLLTRRGKQATGYPDSVATTWSLSFQKIEQSNPAAAELLRLCAFLAPDHIPEELLKEGAPYWTPLLQSAVADLLAFNQMIEDLLAFSLVKRLAEDQMLSIHRLVQAVQMDRMDHEEQCQWAERIVRVVNAVFPRDPKEDVASWPNCLRYLEQVQACDTLIQKHRFMLPEAADVLNRSGIYLREHASYTLAEPLFQRAVQIWEQSLGPQHPDVASSLNGLADLYSEQGKYAKAEPLYQQALQIWEQSLGPQHPHVAYPLNGLAVLYKEQGKYAKAEPLYQRALQIREQSLGPQHLLVAYPLNNLAIVYAEQGKYAEAEPLFQRALQIWEQSLGPQCPQAARTLNNLAVLYKEQGKYAEVEPLFQRALHIREQNLGPQHPLVAHPLTGLADLYREQGKYVEAEPLYQRALQIREQSLGPQHPLVAYPLNGLAILYREQGKYVEAEPIYRRALQIREQGLGPQHPDVAPSLTGLAVLYKEQGKYAEAEPLYQRALHILEQSLGPQYPLTQQVRSTYASLLRTIGRDEEAQNLDEGSITV